MLTVGLGLILAVAMSMPHLLPLRALTPTTAAAVWLAALALRALVSVGAALFLFVYLPQTAVFEAVAAWCWHAVIPLLTTHLGLSGHPVADAASILPAVLLAGSFLWLIVGLGRAALSLRRWLSRHELAARPDGTTVVDEPDAVVAVTQFGPPRVVISRGALGLLDEAEVRASVAHEWGHVRRRHRPLLLAATMLASLGRWLPGTRAAERELGLALERDADVHAIRATGDPLALASAICKVALHGRTGQALTGLAHGPVEARLELLLDGSGRRPSRIADRGGKALAVALVALSLMLVASFPAWAAASTGDGHPAGVPASCPH